MLGFFALGLGALNLLRFHGERLLTMHKDWFYSAICLGFLVVGTAVGLVGGTQHPVYRFLFATAIEACQASATSRQVSLGL